MHTHNFHIRNVLPNLLLSRPLYQPASSSPHRIRYVIPNPTPTATRSFSMTICIIPPFFLIISAVGSLLGFVLFPPPFLPCNYPSSRRLILTVIIVLARRLRKTECQ